MRRVTIHEGDLPIALSPERRVWHAQVAPATTTVLRVPLELRLGASGLLTTASGAAAADVDVVVVDDAGQEAGRTRSNRFGQFRIDGLPPGRYRARAGGAEVAFELVDDFVFGLALSGLPDAPASTDEGEVRVLDRVSSATPSAGGTAPVRLASASSEARPIGWTRRASDELRDASASGVAATTVDQGADRGRDRPAPRFAGSPGVPVPGMPLPTPRPGPRLADAPAGMADAGAATVEAFRAKIASPGAFGETAVDNPVASAAAADAAAARGAPSSTGEASPSLVEEARSLLSRASLGDVWSAASSPLRSVLAPFAQAPEAAAEAGGGASPSGAPSSRPSVAPAVASLPVSELAPVRGPLPAARRDATPPTFASGPGAAPARPSG